MNLTGCLKQARDELISSGARVSTSDIVQRALDINGARDELEARALDKAMTQLRREARRLLDEMTEAEIDRLRDSDGSLYSLLPGLPAPLAIALPGDAEGEYVYKAYGATTDEDLAANDAILTANIERARTKRQDRRRKRMALRAYRADGTTTIDALRRMAQSQDGAA